ncbi:hypothetical protein [Alteromonas macleodii]|uniref:hypothetical protein n=1 Tax=Alteromonas macleodii TaxID=28108 RepID=UPI00314071D5
MNINEPLFPSGISLARAKKDAKKLKKLEDITLTQALNRVAQQHMSNPYVTWEQSITELKSTHAEVVALFEDCLSKSELEQFLSAIEQDTSAGDSFISITPANDGYIESDGNGGAMWPNPLIVSSDNVEYFCKMLNKMSFQDFQVLYLDYEMEELVSIDLYDMWEDSNYPTYDSNDSVEFDVNEDNDQLYDSYFELKRRVKIAIDWCEKLV